MRALLVACVVLVVGQAHAASVSFTDGRTYFRADEWTLPKFDPNLGTLTGVSFDISHVITSDSVVFRVFENTTGQTQPVNVTSTIDVMCCGLLGAASTSFSAKSFSFMGTQTPTGTFNFPPGTFNIAATFAGPSDSPPVEFLNLTPSLPLDFFVAAIAGEVFGIESAAVETFTQDNPLLRPIGGGDEFVGVRTTTTVNYEFTPVSEVPLPGALILLLSALGCLLGIRFLAR